ncbi:c-type cytochrome [Mucilaginibacter ginkgonis]|uniref:Photosynthetic reaction center cytochrome c subunit n=1 Tax=Mucilaginibacter ginkgonis TaxID=2682091 RepID=A0A6I4I1Z0_9SPHI|nr:c-type cytochrome [Mucilaginibacter ginkgonis]QQL50638.1 c-type cytochrome [Mucilaginibacter ginkgonis]
MNVNKKMIAVLGFSAVIGLSAMTVMQPGQPRVDPPLQNIKVLSKKLTYRQVDHIMDEWAHSLGVRCNFCHAPNEQTKKMDFASDAKPEKEMAREMFKMTAEINKKYFKAEKDSLGMIMESGVNCYTCHNGKAHPEVVEAPAPPRRNGPPGGTPPAGGMPPPGGNPPTTPPAGTPPAGSTPAHSR